VRKRRLACSTVITLDLFRLAAGTLLAYVHEVCTSRPLQQYSG
jgi:hypothetical protein